MIVAAHFQSLKGNDSKMVRWLTQNAFLQTDWIAELKGVRGKYAKEKNGYETYSSVVDGMKDTIAYSCTEAIPGSRELKAIVDGYQQNILNNQIHLMPGGLSNEESAEEAFAYVEAFRKYLDEQRISFAFVQVPDDVRIRECKNSTVGEYENLSEAADFFAEKMHEAAEKDANMAYLNISENRELLGRFSLEASNHWMPQDALAAAGEVAALMQSEFDCQISTDSFDPEKYYNLTEGCPELAAKLESEFGYRYHVPIPTETQHFSVEYNEEEIAEGDFASVFLNEPEEWDRRGENADGEAVEAVTYHNFFRIDNGTLLTSRNGAASETQMRVLVLGDSFSWPIVVYLAQEVKELGYLHPSYFWGDTRKYIEYFQPDLVLWIYNDSQIGSNNVETFGAVD